MLGLKQVNGVVSNKSSRLYTLISEQRDSERLFTEIGYLGAAI